MKKILSILLSIFTIVFTGISPIYAKETSDSNIYDLELSNSIISGSGTENDPYIVDYQKAPHFYNYVVNVYQEAKGANLARASGFTGYVLTAYKGTYNNGGVWVYQSGGLSVNADGNLRVQKVAYISNQQANQIVAAMSVPTTWSYISETISFSSGLLSGAFINKIVTALSNKGITSIKGHSTRSIGLAIATGVSAVGAYLSSSDFIKFLINNGMNSGLNSAVSNGTSAVNISYLSSYHGAWYQNTTSEGGWKGNAVYIPSSTYGSGTFVSN